MESAAAKPQSLSPAPPMAQDRPDQSPKAMTPAELEAAIAALPAKKDALREAFHRLAACSPFPLPFIWDDLDAHISSIQSSIALRHRQLRVLEAARPGPGPVSTGDDEKRTNQGDGETSEEEEEEVEEEEEAEEEEQETEEAEEGDEEVVEEVVVEEEYEEEEEVEVEVEEEDEVDANNVANKDQNSDEEMLEAQEDEVEEHKELVATDDKEQKVHKVEKTKKAKKVLLKGDLQDDSKDLVKACASMDTQSLVNLLFKTTIARREYRTAVSHAKDAAALILDVVRRFLPHKMTKINQVWENCVMLIRCVPLVEPKLSVHTTEQAKQLAKDWKKMIDKGESCGDLGNLSSWALLYFLISYNIVSEFDAGEIIRLFGTVPCKYLRRNCLNLCNSLGLINRISDLIDYLIGNGQELSAIQMTRVFKLVDKYPPLSLLEGYVEKAKRTALELLSKNVSDKSLNLAKTKETDNLWVAHAMIKRQHADCSKSSTILEEINNLLAEYKKSHTLANASTASTLNSRQQQKEEQKGQKRKKEQQQREGQDRQVQGKQRKLKGNQEQPQESKDQQRHENKGNAQAKKQKQQQQQIEPQKTLHQHLNQPRPCVTKLATTVGPSPRFVPPAVTTVAQISPSGYQPFAVMPGAYQPCFPGIQGGPLAANSVLPQYNPFQQNHLYPHPSFYPR